MRTSCSNCKYVKFRERKIIIARLDPNIEAKVICTNEIVKEENETDYQPFLKVTYDRFMNMTSCAHHKFKS